jgi:hypothetical protein
MAAMLKSYFDRLLEQGLPREATINFGAIGIMQQDLATLELPFMEEEVWHTLRACLGNGGIKWMEED